MRRWRSSSWWASRSRRTCASCEGSGEPFPFCRRRRRRFFDLELGAEGRHTGERRWQSSDRDSEDDNERERMAGRRGRQESLLAAPPRVLRSRERCLGRRTNDLALFCRTKRYAGRQFPNDSEGGSSESVRDVSRTTGAQLGIGFDFQAQIPCAAQTTELRSEFQIP